MTRSKHPRIDRTDVANLPKARSVSPWLPKRKVFQRLLTLLKSGDFHTRSPPRDRRQARPQPNVPATPSVVLSRPSKFRCVGKALRPHSRFIPEQESSSQLRFQFVNESKFYETVGLHPSLMKPSYRSKLITSSKSFKSFPSVKI